MPKTAPKPQLTAVTALNPWCCALDVQPAQRREFAFLLDGPLRGQLDEALNLAADDRPVPDAGHTAAGPCTSPSTLSGLWIPRIRGSRPVYPLRQLTGGPLPRPPRPSKSTADRSPQTGAHGFWCVRGPSPLKKPMYADCRVLT